jgi:hypothetical protein
MMIGPRSRLVFSLLGHALRLGELRPPEPADHSV